MLSLEIWWRGAATAVEYSHAKIIPTGRKITNCCEDCTWNKSAVGGRQGNGFFYRESFPLPRKIGFSEMILSERGTFRGVTAVICFSSVHLNRKCRRSQGGGHPQLVMITNMPHSKGNGGSMRKPYQAFVMLIIFSFGVLFMAINLPGRDKGRYSSATLRVGDIRTSYLEAGSGNRVLIFVPGWTMPAEIWREQLPYFAARGFRALAIDPRSQGNTTKTETGNTYQQQAADLHGFIQRLQLENVSLIGWEAGATTILEYISSPETARPDKIVLIDSSPAFLPLNDSPGLTTMQQAHRLLIGLQEDRAAVTENRVRGLFSSGQRELLIRDLTSGSLKTPLSAAVSLFADLLTGDRRPALQRVTVPSLVITTTGNRAVGEYMTGRMPDSELKIIEDAGSALFLEKPQTFNQLLEAFLK
jgi:non-heme chloroperoxidase